MSIARARLVNQHIAGNRLASVADVVRSLGAVQAQDYGQSLWALGLRTPGATIADVEQALRDGEIIRTWAMRGTIHHILAEDARWMLDLLAARSIARLTPKAWSYHHMDDERMTLAHRTCVDALQGAGTLTRKQLVERLGEAGIPNDRQQGYFIFSYLCQRGVLCPGPPHGKEQTFALLDEWAPNQRSLARDEALAVLAERFFTSHGPATIADFANWAGIPKTEARLGLDGAAGALVADVIGGVEHWRSPGSAVGDGVHLLPAYDEFLIGYQDRGAAFEKYGEIPIATYNAMFFAMIVEDGQLAGLWKRVLKKTGVDIELFPRPGFDIATIEPHADELSAFLGLPHRVVVRDGLPTDGQPRSFRERRGA